MQPYKFPQGFILERTEVLDVSFIYEIKKLTDQAYKEGKVAVLDTITISSKTEVTIVYIGYIEKGAVL